MMREQIYERLKRNNSPVWIWKDYNDFWNDLNHVYGITEKEFKKELELLVVEGKLIVKDLCDKYPKYYLSEEFMLYLGIK